MYLFWLISCSRWKMWIWVSGCKRSTILHQFNLHTTGGSFNLDVRLITTRLTINLLARWCACGTILGKAKLAGATSDDIVEAIILLLPWFINIILVFSNQQKKQIGHPMRKFDHLPAIRFWVMPKLFYVFCVKYKIVYHHFIRHLFFLLVYQYLICSSFPNKDTNTREKNVFIPHILST